MPPLLGNLAASSGMGEAPQIATAPPMTEAGERAGHHRSSRATSAGVRKIPLPTVDPITTATALQESQSARQPLSRGPAWLALS